jgi:hypothetical protein
MTDSKPGDKPASYPIYSVEPHGRPNPTGSFKRYQPKVLTIEEPIMHQSKHSLLAVMTGSRPWLCCPPRYKVGKSPCMPLTGELP